MLLSNAFYILSAIYTNLRIFEHLGLISRLCETITETLFNVNTYGVGTNKYNILIIGLSLPIILTLEILVLTVVFYL